VSRYEWQTVDLKQYPNVERWYRAIAARPAVQTGYHVPKKVQEIPIRLALALTNGLPKS
jgi:GST-like protein